MIPTLRELTVRRMGGLKKCVNIFYNVISAIDEASYRTFRRRKGHMVEKKKF